MVRLFAEDGERFEEEDLWFDHAEALDHESVVVSLLAERDLVVELILSEALSAHGAAPDILNFGHFHLLNRFSGEYAHGARLDQLLGLCPGDGAGEGDFGLQLVEGGGNGRPLGVGVSLALRAEKFNLKLLVLSQLRHNYLGVQHLGGCFESRLLVA